MGKKVGVNVPVSFRPSDSDLLDWTQGQACKRYLKLSSFSSVVRACLRICRKHNLLSKLVETIREEENG